MKDLFGLIKRKTKSVLRVECVRQPCAFRMHLNPALGTLKRLVIFLEEKKVIIDQLQLNRSSNGSAMVVLYCLIEKQNIIPLVNTLQGFPGVHELESIDC
jgi:hypothetical protein